MKVLLRNPSREVEVDGRRNVNSVLAELALPRESHLVIRNGTLVPGDADLAADGIGDSAKRPARRVNGNRQINLTG